MATPKIVAVSTDDITYYTLPGSSGELQNEAGSIDDTVFGQNYQSNEIGLISWTSNATGYYKGFAGYMAKIKQAGTSTVMTTEPMTLVAGKTYKVTADAKNLWNPAVTLNVFDNGVNKNADVESINYLTGRVTFKAAYNPTGPITVTGAYYPTVTLGKAQSYSLTQTAETIDSTDFGTAQANGGFRTFLAGLQTVSLELTGFYNVTAGLRDALQARTLLIIEIDPSGTGKSICRGFFKLASEGQSGDVGALEEETATFNLQVPSSLYAPFAWLHAADTTLSLAIRTCLDAWLAGTSIFVKYQYDGINGTKGSAVVTECSLSGGLDDMNEFTFSFQGSGATTPVGTG